MLASGAWLVRHQGQPPLHSWQHGGEAAGGGGVGVGRLCCLTSREFPLGCGSVVDSLLGEALLGKLAGLGQGEGGWMGPYSGAD